MPDKESDCGLVSQLTPNFKGKLPTSEDSKSLLLNQNMILSSTDYNRPLSPE